MKYLVLLGDGMADWPLEELEGKTPLEAASTPWMDLLAQRGQLGRTITVPEGMPPDSSIANMSLFGYDPRRFYPGRGPLEAAALGIPMEEGDVAFRCNLVTLSEDGEVLLDYSAGHISSDEARGLFSYLQERLGDRKYEFFSGVGFRGLLVVRKLGAVPETTPPHDIMGQGIRPHLPKGRGAEGILELMEKAKELLKGHPLNRERARRGLNPANGIWPWGGGLKPKLQPFRDRFGLQGAVVAGVDLIRGIGALLGLKVIRVPGATGFIDTDYRAKAEAGLRALEEVDFLYLHVEAPDEASHMGSLEEKIRAIERFDAEVVGRVYKGLEEKGEPFRILVATDHPTPLGLRTHVRGEVPFVLYDSTRTVNSGARGFCEPEAQKGVFLEDATELTLKLLGRA